MSVLATLQQMIEALHDVAIDLDVDAFVVDAAVRAQIPGAKDGLPEQLFVRQEADALELALYVDRKIIETLERDAPARRLHEGNLESYCVALEGVSHFVFVAYRAQVGRPVTSLELELQAEVDKFVNAWLLLGEQGCGLGAGAKLLDLKLFGTWELRGEVGPDEAQRYHTASRAARRYCAKLAERHASSGDPQRIKQDVRAFYRQGLADKLRAA